MAKSLSELLSSRIAIYALNKEEKDTYKKINYVLKIQPEALIIQIYSVIKLYKFRASYLPIIRNFLLYIRHW